MESKHYLALIVVLMCMVLVLTGIILKTQQDARQEEKCRSLTGYSYYINKCDG